MNHHPATRPAVRSLPCLLAAILLAGCGNNTKKDPDFFTSGSREADQRAEQRVTKTQQLRGEGQNTKDKEAAAKPTLYERLGGDAGLSTIVSDFVDRALADPRVNWQRKDLTTGGFLHFHQKSLQWNPTPGDLQLMKTHIAQFIAVATGGPPKYQGRAIKESHAGLKITNAEFDASIGDMKATLDKFGVNIQDQKELLAIIESTRSEIVEIR